MAADRTLLACLVMETLLLSTWLSDAAAENPFECHETTPCSGHLPGPGPMNMSAIENVTMMDFQGRKGAIWHCVHNFTSFQWYRLINNTLVMFPWGRHNGIQLCDNNQTIIINSLETRDAGTYMFRASNGTVELRGYFTKEVVCDPVLSQLTTKEQPVQYVAPGSQKVLHCAADFGDCGYYDGAVMWLVNTSRGQEHLRNSTDRFITCNAGGYNGQSCNLTFSKVSEEDFQHEYICRLYTPQISPGAENQYSVHLLPFYPVNALLLGIVTGCTLVCVFVSVMAFVYMWRHRESIKFWLRRQPDRGKFQHDVVLIHGDDHMALVQNYLRPHLCEEGYDICTERPGMPELLEQSYGIREAYSVIFSFSPRELLGPGSEALAHLAAEARLSHSRNYVIFIRREQDADVSISSQVNGEAATSAAEEAHVEDSGMNRKQDPWKHTAYRSFKHVTWPSTDTDQQSEQSLLGSFWIRLHNHLPRLQPTANSVPSLHEQRNSSSSTGSHQPLLRTCDPVRQVRVIPRLQSPHHHWNKKPRV